MSSSALAAGLRLLRGKMALQCRSAESDEQLLHAFLTSRDDDAFAVLVHRHGPMVLHVCRRVLGHEQDAEDAFQATFLVLARNAASLRNKTMLAGFLHGTAYRMAMKTKQSAARRRKHEGRAPSRPPFDPTEEISWREVRTLLDEEIAALPKKYRSVFVLCCLENQSQAEAGRRLGLKERTVSNRLAEARKQLGQRLARRGVELTAVLSAATLATGTASAVPVALMASTLKAVVAAAAGEGLAGIVSASVVELVQGAAILSKAKIAVVVLLAASMISGAGVWAYRGSTANAVMPLAQPAEPPSAKADEKPKAVAPKPKEAKTVEIQGRVLGPDGKPKAGAKLLLATESAIESLGVSAADGCFTAAIPKEAKDDYLIAQAADAGIDFLPLRQWKSGKAVELRLVKDNPIRGRIVNTEGRPIAGVRVAAKNMSVHINNTLDTFLAAFIKILAGGKGGAERKTLWSGAEKLFAVTTDADGHFTLSGIGAERTVRLLLSGGGIADTVLLKVANRSGFDPEPYNRQFRDYFTRANGRKDQRWMAAHLLYGPDLSLVAESEKVIRGVVRDADTGKEQAGLSIRLIGYYDDMWPPIHLEAETDTSGRYEIHGARKATQYLIQFHGDTETGYTPRQIWAKDTPAYQPVAADLKVKKGVIVTGKVIDAGTGKPIDGWAKAAVLSGNSFVKEYEYDRFATTTGMPFVVRSTEKEDGTFRVVILPGPVLLMGGPNFRKLGTLGALQYKLPYPDPKYPDYFQAIPQAVDEMRFTYSGLKGFHERVEGNFCKVLDVKPGVAVVKQDIVLERAHAVTVQIRDAVGRPLSGVWATGISPRRRIAATQLENDFCPVYHLEAGKPRLLVFGEPTRKLAGTRTLQGDEKEPVLVKLDAMASVQGRLLDADGKPLAGLEVDLRYRATEAEEVYNALHNGRQVVTDAHGSFTLDELLPDLPFALRFRRGRIPFERTGKPAEATIQVKPGECRDLGAIKLKQISEKPGE